MQNYRRAFVPGGSWFFTANLLDRRSSLLTDQIDAWSRYRQALGAIALNGWNEKALAQAVAHLRDAVAIDPDFSLAHAMLALLVAISANLPFAEDQSVAHREALQEAETAVALDPSNAQSHVALGAVQVQVREFDAGINAMQHGIRLSPRDVKLPFWRMILAAGLA
jgi:Tfp pilus assembly protein PilF